METGCSENKVRGSLFQIVDKPYEEVPEGHHDPLTGFVSTGYAGRAGGSAKGETIPSIFHGRRLC